MAFDGKVILITGGNGGIGAGCAEYFAKEKGLLSLVGRNAKKFENVLDKIQESGAGTIPLVIIGDITVDSERIISETIEQYGRIDVLINNAAFSIPGTLETLKLEDYDAMFATNVRATMELTQLAVPHLAETKGNIINISSVVGIRAFTNYLCYGMSKAALHHFTQCIALELAPKGIRVNSVNPGVIDTDFHITAGTQSEDYPDVLQYLGQNHPIGRTGEIKEVVNAIAFLANENTTFVSGICLPVDGMLSIKSPIG